MNWWGKVIGGAFGFSVLGPLGVLFGAAIGHMFDQGLDPEQWAQGNTERVQTAFFTATFSIMGYLAKSDGQVTRDEIDVAEGVMDQMQLNPEQRKAAIQLFNQGKKENFPVDDVLVQFKTECHRRSTLIQMFVEIQIMTVLADGVYHRDEETALKKMAVQLGYNHYELSSIMSRMQAEYAWSHQGEQSSYSGDSGRSSGGRGAKPSSSGIDYAYSILGVTSDASDAEIKKAYRRLMSQHHPDKLVSKGLPEEMMALAKKKAQDITRAYDTIKKSRR